MLPLGKIFKDWPILLNNQCFIYSNLTQKNCVSYFKLLNGQYILALIFMDYSTCKCDCQSGGEGEDGAY